jgi:tyrosine-protein phosphatase SIW14
MILYRTAARKCAAALTVTLCLSAPLFARKTTPSPAISRIHINNFGRISDTYYRGAQPDAQGFADLAALGVKTVIDLTGEEHGDEQSIVEHDGMRFYRIPLTTSQSPSDAEIALFLKLVTDPADQPVFVHCQGGRHRTGVMTAVYRITHDGWNADRAVAEMKHYRFDRFPTHPKLKSFVFAYYSHLPQPKIAEHEGVTAEVGASK